MMGTATQLESGPHGARILEQQILIKKKRMITVWFYFSNKMFIIRHDSHLLSRHQPYLKSVVRRSDRHRLVVGNVDIRWTGQDLVGERSEEGHVLLVISHCPRPQRQSVGYILLVSGMDPETKQQTNHIELFCWDPPPTWEQSLVNTKHFWSFSAKQRCSVLLNKKLGT